MKKQIKRMGFNFNLKKQIMFQNFKINYCQFNETNKFLCFCKNYIYLYLYKSFLFAYILHTKTYVKKILRKTKLFLCFLFNHVRK